MSDTIDTILDDLRGRLVRLDGEIVDRQVCRRQIAELIAEWSDGRSRVRKRAKDANSAAADPIPQFLQRLAPEAAAGDAGQQEATGHG